MKSSIYLSGGLLGGERRIVAFRSQLMRLPFSVDSDWAKGVTVPYRVHLISSQGKLCRFWFPLGWTFAQRCEWIKDASKEEMTNVERVWR